MLRLLVGTAIVSATALAAGPALSQTLNVGGSSRWGATWLDGAKTDSARAYFTFVDATTLTIKLVNTSQYSSNWETADLLGGIFFDIGGTPALGATGDSAMAVSPIANPSNCQLPCSSTGTIDVGRDWVRQSSSTPSLPGNTHYGVVSAAAGAANSWLPHGTTFSSASSVDNTASALSIVGPNYSAGAATNTFALIKNYATFTLKFSGNQSQLDITNIKFGFGPASSTPNNVNGVIPEPATLAVFGVGLAVLGGSRLRSRRRAARSGCAHE